MLIMDALGCSFTGHRKIEDEHRATLPGLLCRAIGFAYGEGCRRFYVGGAVGFDTVAAQQLIVFRMSHPDIRICVLVPCKSQADSWSAKQREMYDYVLSVADEVEYVSDEYTSTCMKKRNERLVALCDIMISYVGRARSGAAQTLRMAEKAGKRVYNLYGKK